MRKTQFILACIVLLSNSSPPLSFAHTISQHIQELYGETYLPLFVISKILPFFALGILSDDRKPRNLAIGYSWILFFGLLLGAIMTFIDSNLNYLIAINNFTVLLIGLILLLLNRPPENIILLLLLIFGISVGYEYTLTIAHAEEFKWLFIGILLTGLIIFKYLSKYQFFKTGIRNVIRITAGLIFVVAGLIVILLT